MHRLVDAMFGLSDDGPGALHAAIDAADTPAEPAPVPEDPPAAPAAPETVQAP